MKRLFLVMLVLVLAMPLIAQDYNQNMIEAWNLTENIYWTFQKQGATTEEYFLDIKAADTLYSKPYANAPGIGLEATLADSNASADSILVKVNAQWSMKDTSSWTSPIALRWSDDTGSSVSVVNISTAADWFCDLAGQTTYPGSDFMRLQVIALSGHRVTNPGVKGRFRCKAHKQ